MGVQPAPAAPVAGSEPAIVENAVGRYFFDGLGTGIGSTPRISGNGMIMLGSLITGPGVVSGANATVLYAGFPGGLQLVARQGDPAPSTVGATISSNLITLTTQSTAINSNGQVLFLTSLAGGDVAGTTNNLALYGGFPGALQMLVRKGDLGPNAEIISGIAAGVPAQMNELGQAFFDVTYTVGSGSGPVASGDDRALYVATPGSGNQILAREGDSAGIPGVIFSGGSATPFGVGTQNFNNSGQAFVASNLSGSVTPGINDRGIFILATTGPTTVARRGDAVCFASSILGTGIVTTNDTGIWVGSPGNLTLIAREGDLAPGTNGGTFGSTTLMPIQLNAAGQVAFANTIVGGTNPSAAYFVYDPATGTRPLIRVGDSVEVSPGVFKVVSSTVGPQLPNGGGRSLGFANDGNIAHRINFADGTSGIVKVRYGTLTGAAPRISGQTGGTHTLYLDAGPIHAGEIYVVVGSISGTTPGTPAGSVLFPINVDFYTQLMLGSLNTPPLFNTLGSLDADGRAIAAIQLPPAIGYLAGLTLDYAFGTLDALGVANFASEPATLTIIP